MKKYRNGLGATQRIALAVIILALSGCASEHVGPAGFQTLRAQPLPAPVVLTDPQQAKIMGAQSFRQQDFGLALRQFQAAAVMAPSDAEVWLGLGAAADNAGHFGVSGEAYARVLSLTGPSVEYFNNLGFSYTLQGKLFEARLVFQDGLKIAPRNTTLRNNLSIVDRMEGRSPVGTAK